MTIALNSAFHTKENPAVKGPFHRLYRVSQYKLFLVAFGAMFIYFWFQNFLFSAPSYFSWITWIDPTNITLAVLTGFNNGLGFNPWPAFD